VARQDGSRNVKLKRKGVDGRRLEPDDVVGRLDAGFAVVVRDMVMRCEMTVDDGVRVRLAELVRMRWGNPGSEDQERHGHERRGEACDPSKHACNMWVDPECVK
jgi:hypothetical protein